MFFNEDGTIRKVIPTLRGVSLTPASKKIQIDRFSTKSGDDVRVEFLDSLNKFEGWKTIFGIADSWIRYNSVFFSKAPGYISVKARSETGGTLLISTANAPEKIVATVKIPKENTWHVVRSKVLSAPTGIKDLVVKFKGNGNVEVD